MHRLDEVSQVALDMLTGIAVAIAALTAAVVGRREFLDVAFGIGLISFVATCAFAALLEDNRAELADIIARYTPKPHFEAATEIAPKTGKIPI